MTWLALLSADALLLTVLSRFMTIWIAGPITLVVAGIAGAVLQAKTRWMGDFGAPNPARRTSDTQDAGDSRKA
jgi:hypothetical protein